jgi:hypothetical protein
MIEILRGFIFQLTNPTSIQTGASNQTRTEAQKQTTMKATLTQLETALKDTPNLSELAYLKGKIAATRLNSETSAHIECEKVTLGELARALQVESHWNGRTYSLTIENGAHFVILQTPVISVAK